MIGNGIDLRVGQHLLQGLQHADLVGRAGAAAREHQTRLRTRLHGSPVMRRLRGSRRRLSLVLAYRCTRSARVLQHLGRVAPRGLGDLEAAQHARDLVDALLRIERLRRSRRCRAGPGAWPRGAARARATATCARCVTHSTWWCCASDCRSWPTISATPPPMPAVDLVEDQRRHRGAAREQHLDRERQARELAARGDARERRQRLARVRGDLQLDRLEPARGGLVERFERHREAPALHGEALHRLGDLAAQLLRARRGAPSRARSAASRYARLGRGFLLAQLLEALLAAQLGEPRAALLRARPGMRARLDAVLARAVEHRLQARGRARRGGPDRPRASAGSGAAAARPRRRARSPPRRRGARPRAAGSSAAASREPRAACASRAVAASSDSSSASTHADTVSISSCAVGEAAVLGLRPRPRPRLEGERLEVADLVGEQLALARRGRLRALARRRAARRRARHARERRAVSRASASLPPKASSSARCAVALEQQLVLVLAVDVEQPLAQLAQLRDRGRAPVHERARAAREVDRAAQEAGALALVEVVAPRAIRAPPRAAASVEFRARPPRARAPARTTPASARPPRASGERVDEDRLARARSRR